MQEPVGHSSHTSSQFTAWSSEGSLEQNKEKKEMQLKSNRKEKAEVSYEERKEKRKYAEDKWTKTIKIQERKKVEMC